MDQFQPACEQDAAEFIAASCADQTPLQIVGSGSKSGFGRPVQTRQGLSTSLLSGIRLYEPEELVVVAAAGTPLAVLEQRLAASNQRLSFEPPKLGAVYASAHTQEKQSDSDGGGTIGGLVACNLSGPRRVRDGAARDNILGMRLINGTGEIIKTGGRVMKNVTGLDVSKIVTGSHGTTGLLTEVAFKVLPCPERTVTLCLHSLPEREGCQLLRAALATPWEVSGASHIVSAVKAPQIASKGAVTLIRLEGFEDQIHYRCQALMAHLSHLAADLDAEIFEDAASDLIWTWLRDWGPAHSNLGTLLWRVSLRPTDGPAFAKAARNALGPNIDIWYDWGGGLVFILCDPADLSGGDPAYAIAIRQCLEPFGGHATLVRAPDSLRATEALFHPLSPTHQKLETHILQAFDPVGILNSGRMRQMPPSPPIETIQSRPQ